MPQHRVTAPTRAAVAMARCQRPAPPNVSTATRTPAIVNQTLGGRPARETPAKSAIPAIEPPMSKAYARSGGMARRRGPSGNARNAIAVVVRTKRLGRTKKLMSSRCPSRVANQRSPSSFLTLTCASDTNSTRPNAMGANHTAVDAPSRRPRRMPIPMPRKLARSRKLLKKPTYTTFAGTHRIRRSSTNSRVALVRKSRTRASRSIGVDARATDGAASVGRVSGGAVRSGDHLEAAAPDPCRVRDGRAVLERQLDRRQARGRVDPALRAVADPLRARGHPHARDRARDTCSARPRQAPTPDRRGGVRRLRLQRPRLFCVDVHTRVRRSAHRADDQPRSNRAFGIVHRRAPH